MQFPWDEIRTREVDGIKDLIIVITQDSESGQVLMSAFTNKEGIEKTLKTGYVHYFSTTRKKIWLKGETSGHTQRVKEIYIDCDGDAILIKVEQEGGACHKGYRSCFFRQIREGQIKISQEKIFNPEEVY